ncbi:MAG: tRNA (N(6)-L-threonylcarbamoyladenosine(37)-C(2))-methylthiotransferase MtaB [Holosporales bacterium]|nr:tRNA (N(6)-L-threonylcarbamoyladenosine(37)-C(2))-methylthiotransferase MtaB [Holosporales bacterium]
MKKSIKTVTLGCRFNSYESEVAKAMLEEAKADSDIVVINTCSVTHEAERQSRQAVRKAIRENRSAKIIVTGCAAKTSYEYFKALDGVHKIIQNDEKLDIGSYATVVHPDDNDDNPTESAARNPIFRDRIRAFLQIQNGCDNYCTYCIVPITRGPPRSLPIKDIMLQIEASLVAGCKEIVLSGIDITSYGRDLAGPVLADVIETVLKEFPDVTRLRISSLDPHGIDNRLLGLFTGESRIMPHLHLSIQSGDDTVLTSMRRRHTRDDVITLCQKILDLRPDVVLGCDLIAGFPAETEAMFQNTMSLVDEAHLTLLHVFPYSPRTGTAAANMIQLPREVVLKRAEILREKAIAVKHKLFKTLVGTTVRGILEKFADGIWYGKTDSFIPFRFSQLSHQQLSPGSVITALVTGFNDQEGLVVDDMMSFDTS